MDAGETGSDTEEADLDVGEADSDAGFGQVEVLEPPLQFRRGL